MPTITLKNVPSAVHQGIKRRAKQNRRSINNEILASLESLLGLHEDEATRLLKQMENAHQGIHRTLTIKEIQMAKEEGRK